jgi:hypothetical protein
MSETGIKVLEVWLVVRLRLRMRWVLLRLVPGVAMRAWYDYGGGVGATSWTPLQKKNASSLDVCRIFVFLWNIIRKITLPPIFI